MDRAHRPCRAPACSAARSSTAPPAGRSSMTSERRAADLLDQYQTDIYRRTDRLFAGLMGLQWIAGIVFAVWVAPLTWVGTTSQTHVHVWAAIFLGGAISLFPAILALARPGMPSTRYIISTAQ